MLRYCFHWKSTEKKRESEEAKKKEREDPWKLKGYIILQFALGILQYASIEVVTPLQNSFLKKFCGFVGIGLFVSSDTYKGKAAYIRISPDPA